MAQNPPDYHATKANLDELHSLIDCIQSDMTLSGLDGFDRDSLGTLGQTLLAFFEFHQDEMQSLEILEEEMYGE